MSEVLHDFFRGYATWQNAKPDPQVAVDTTFPATSFHYNEDQARSLLPFTKRFLEFSERVKQLKAAYKVKLRYTRISESEGTLKAEPA